MAAAEEELVVLGETEEGDDEYEYYEEGEEEEAEEEVKKSVVPKKTSSESGRSGRSEGGGSVKSMKSNMKMRPYQNPLTKPVFAAGGTTIGLSQAKLFGLLDENGNIKLKAAPPDVLSKDLSKGFAVLDEMSQPRELDLSHVVTEDAVESTFKPERSKQAQNAMRNPRCGYDFIERLENETGGFLERAFGNEKSKSKAEKLLMETAKEDYVASHDKLACPSCKREQTFDEFWEKKRNCSSCQKRYEKVNVCNGASFEKRMKEQEEARQAKLKLAESAVYGKKEKTQPASRPKEMLPKSRSGAKRGEDGDQGEDEEASPEGAGGGGIALPIGGRSNTGELLKKLAKLNNDKQDLLDATIAAAQQKGKLASEFLDLDDKLPSSSLQQTKAKRSKDKFEALLDF